MKFSGTIAAWALGMALIAGRSLPRAELRKRNRQQLNRTDLAPAALQQADALIEKYVQPVAEPEPTPQQKQGH